MTTPRHGEATHGSLHHIELWVDDLPATRSSLGWLLEELGYRVHQEWDAGCSWILGGTYIVVEQSPARRPGPYDRLRPGLNHLAFHVADRPELDRLVEAASLHGWTMMYADRHPYAGGPDHCAAYLEDRQDFEIELVVMA